MPRMGTLLLLLLLTAGCAASGQAPSPAPPPEPPSPSGIVRRDSGWEIPVLDGRSPHYMWSPDRRWVAFHHASGLWAVHPEGSVEQSLVEGNLWRELVGWTEAGLVYLEQREDKVAIGVVSPGHEAQVITTINHLPLGHVLHDGYLALFPEDRPPFRVGLASGQMTELEPGDRPFRCVPASTSPDGRYVAVREDCAAATFWMVDLKEWTAWQSGPDLYPSGITWSPTKNRWAALAGAGEDRTATGVPLATHLDVGNTEGQIEHLEPPQPLKLVERPFWSPDGKRLAVVAEVKPASDGRGRDATTEVWLVTPATGAWRKLSTCQFVHVRGWHPSGEYLVVAKILSSAGVPDIGQLAIADGRTAWEPLPPLEERDATRLDDRFVVVESGSSQRGAAAYLDRPEEGPPIPLSTGQVPVMDALQVRPPNRSWIAYRDGQPSPMLVVVNDPGSQP